MDMARVNKFNYHVEILFYGIKNNIRKYVEENYLFWLVCKQYSIIFIWVSEVKDFLMKRFLFLLFLLVVFVFSVSVFIEKKSEWVLVRYVEMQNSFLSAMDRDGFSSENIIETKYDGMFLSSVNNNAPEEEVAKLSNDNCLEYDITCATFQLASVSHSSMEVMNGTAIDEYKLAGMKRNLERAALFYDDNSEIQPIKLELATLLYKFASCRFSPDDSCSSDLVLRLRETGFFVDGVASSDYLFYEATSPEIADAYLRVLVRIFDEVRGPVYGGYLKYRVEN